MTIRHCEWCGKITIKFIYRFIIEPEYFVNISHPDVQNIDYEGLKVWTKDGGYINFTIKVKENLLIYFNECIPHLFCSELCEDNFLKKHKIIYRPDFWDSNFVISLKKNLFMPISISPGNINHFSSICDKCGSKFPNISKNFVCSPIVAFKLENGDLKSEPILNRDFALSFSDITEKNPKGLWYHLNIDMKNSLKKLFCSNECAYDFAKEKNNIVIFKNNILKGQMCAINPFTIDINKGLDNPYLYRPSKLEGF